MTIRTSLVIAFLLAACSPTVVLSPSPSPTPPPTQSAVTTSPQPDMAAWTLVRLDAAPTDGRETTVDFIGGEVVAAGSIIHRGDSRETPTAWASADGVSWRQVRLPGGGEAPISMIRWSDRVMVLGRRDNAECPDISSFAIWIRSADGTWRDAPFDPLFCTGGDAAAAASGDRAVIVGRDRDDKLFAWSSQDGLHWTDHPGVFPGAIGGTMRVAPLPHGGFIASGSGDVAAPWVSRSVDGAVWEAPRRLPVPEDGVAWHVVRMEDTVKVFMKHDDEHAEVLTSEDDGTTWTSAVVDRLFLANAEWLRPYPGGLIAAGTGEVTARVAVSAGGQHWRAVSVPHNVPPDGIVGGGIILGRAVLVGFIEPDGNSVPVAWVGPESLLAP